MLSILLLSLPCSLALSAPQAKIVEPATGIEFSMKQKHIFEMPEEDSFEEIPLLGVGVRYKWGLVKVYAVGMYSSENAASCSGSGGTLWHGIVESKASKAVVIKMARTVDAKKLVDALEEAFQPRLALPGRSAAKMPMLRQMIFDVTKGEAKVGDEIVFECINGSTLRVATIRGGQVSTSTTLDDPDIAFALFDTYLGAALPEVAPTLKESIQARLS